MTAWDWEEAARRAGAGRDGRFNCGAVPLTNPRALVWVRASGESETISGPELSRLAARTAWALRRAGVQRGDRVAGLLGRRPESFTVALAAWQLGAIYVPLFSGFRTEALRARLDDAGVTTIVTDPANRPSLAEIEADRRVLVAAAASGGVDADADLDALVASAAEDAGVAETTLGDPATIMYTSGTSGRPKGCVIPHRGLLTLWPYVTHALAVGDDDLVFSTADAGWSYGLYTTGLSVLSLGGARLLYEGPFDPDGWWNAIAEQRVTQLASAPTGFRQLALAGREAIAGRAARLRALTAAGEALDPETIRWYEQELGPTIHDGYGLSELGMLVVNRRGLDAPVPAPGSMGMPLPGFAVRLQDENGRVVGPGEVGRVAVRDDGWFLSATYWGRDAEWQERLVDGWWLTEDRARIDEEGRYWYVGRNDDVIVTAGYNVGPVEVESVLVEHPAVAEAACVAAPDSRKGQVVVAHVVLAGAEPERLLDELRRLVGERVGWHAAPRRVVTHEALPKTESGKIRRAVLRERATEDREPGTRRARAPRRRRSSP